MKRNRTPVRNPLMGAEEAMKRKEGASGGSGKQGKGAGIPEWARKVKPNTGDPRRMVGQMRKEAKEEKEKRWRERVQEQAKEAKEMEQLAQGFGEQDCAEKSVERRIIFADGGECIVG